MTESERHEEIVTRAWISPKAWSIWMTSPKGLIGLGAELPATVGVTGIIGHVG